MTKIPPLFFKKFVAYTDYLNSNISLNYLGISYSGYPTIVPNRAAFLHHMMIIIMIAGVAVAAPVSGLSKKPALFKRRR